MSLKVDCGKNRKWDLFDPKELQRIAHQIGGNMKNTIVTLACLLVAPAAFAQTQSKHESRTTTVTEPITVTGTTLTNEGGSAASYQPYKTLVVNKGSAGRYVLDGPGHVVNTNGEVVRGAIRPGARVRVYYQNTGGIVTIDHVVVD
jgi:hypothetical protein